MNYKPKAPMLTPELARKIINCNNDWIEILTDRLKQGYMVEMTQRQLEAYQDENKRLSGWLEDNK